MSFSTDSSIDISQLSSAPYRRLKKQTSYIEQVSVEKKSIESITTRLPKDILQQLESFNISKVRTKLNETRTMCITNDNTCIIIGGFKDISFFDIDSNMIVNSIKNAHNDYITSLAITNDDSYLISTSYDRTIKIWCMEDLDHFKTISEAHPFGIFSVILTDDEKHFISSSRCDIAVWSFPEGNLVHLIKDAHNHNINQIAYCKNSNNIISVSSDQAIKFWEFGTWNLVHSFEQAHTSSITCIALTTDGNTAITTGKDGSISVWDLKLKRHVHAFVNVHKMSINSVSISPNNKFLLCNSSDKTFSVCDLQNRIYLKSFTAFDGKELVDNKITKNYKYFINLSKDGHIFIINPRVFQEKCKIEKVHENSIADMKLTYNNKYIVTAGQDGNINIWDFELKRKYHSFSRDFAKEFWSIDISPNSDVIASGCTDGLVDIWSISHKAHLHTFNKAHRGEVMCVRFNSNGDKIVSSCVGMIICVWNLQTRNLCFRLEDTHRCFVTSVEMTKNSRFIISASYDRTIKEWDMETKKLSHQIEHAHDGKITNIKLTKDNQMLISASYDQTIKLWNWTAKNLIHTFAGFHKGKIFGLFISHDGKMLVAGDDEHSFAIYNLEIKQHVYTFTNECRLTKFVCVSSDYQWIIASVGDSIEITHNPIQGLTVVNDNVISLFSPFRYLPLASFLESNDFRHKKDLIECYPNLRVFPHGWSWFHIVAIYTDSKELLSSCFQAYSPFEVDLFGWTPLHYLLNNKKKNLLAIDHVLDQLQSRITSHHKSLSLLDSMSDIITNLIELKSPKVVEFLRASVRDPQTIDSNNLELFGDIKDCKKVNYYFSSRYFYCEKVKQNLGIIDGHKKLRVRVLPFRWNYTKTSDNMYNLIKTLQKMTRQSLFETKAISIIIHYLWDNCKRFYLVEGLIFTIMTIMVSMYAMFLDHNLPFQLFIFITGSLYYCFKLFEMYAMGLKNYLGDFSNSLDTVGPLILPTAIICQWTNASEDVRETSYSLMLAYCWVRWIAFFRVFKQMRKLTRVVLSSIKDIRSFLFILTCIVIGLSFIFHQFERDKPYSTHLRQAYNLLYEASNLKDYSVGQAIYLVSLTILVSIIMFNTLIAIISDSFARVQARISYDDSQELLYMIEENISVSRKWNCLKRHFIKRKEGEKIYETEEEESNQCSTHHKSLYQNSKENIDIVTHKEKKQYMFFVEEEKEENAEGPVGKDDWQGEADNVKKFLSKGIVAEDRPASDVDIYKKGEESEDEGVIKELEHKLNKVIDDVGKLSKKEEQKGLNERLDNIEKLLSMMLEGKNAKKVDKAEKSEKNEKTKSPIKTPLVSLGDENQRVVE